MSTGWLRFALVCEFLLAIVAVFTLWSQVGGQGHLDLMIWYVKLLLGCGLSAAIVGMTRTLVRQEKSLSRTTVSWALLILLISVAMGLLTLYYHLHESTDETDEESTTASLAPAARGRRPLTNVRGSVAPATYRAATVRSGDVASVTCRAATVRQRFCRGLQGTVQWL